MGENHFFFFCWVSFNLDHFHVQSHGMLASAQGDCGARTGRKQPRVVGVRKKSATLDRIAGS